MPGSERVVGEEPVMGRRVWGGAEGRGEELDRETDKNRGRRAGKQRGKRIGKAGEKKSQGMEELWQGKMKKKTR